jgi:hypothetical protein
MYNLDINPLSDGLKRFSPFLLLFTLIIIFFFCGKWGGKQSHQDHFEGSRNFIILAYSGEINSQSPEPRSESGKELYTPQVVYVTWGFCSMWFTGGQKDKSVTEKQVGYTVTPLTSLQNVVTVIGNFAEPSWRSHVTFELAESCL